MDLGYKCSECGGIINTTYDSVKQQTVFVCSKCKLEQTNPVNQEIINMNNKEEQILYE